MAIKKNDTFKASDYYRALSYVTAQLENMREVAEENLKSCMETELKKRAEIRKDFDTIPDHGDSTLDDYFKNDWTLQNALQDIAQESAKIFVIDKLLSSID